MERNSIIEFYRRICTPADLHLDVKATYRRSFRGEVVLHTANFIFWISNDTNNLAFEWQKSGNSHDHFLLLRWEKHPKFPWTEPGDHPPVILCIANCVTHQVTELSTQRLASSNVQRSKPRSLWKGIHHCHCFSFPVCLFQVLSLSLRAAPDSISLFKRSNDLFIVYAK